MQINFPLLKNSIKGLIYSVFMHQNFSFSIYLNFSLINNPAIVPESWNLPLFIFNLNFWSVRFFFQTSKPKWCEYRPSLLICSYPHKHSLSLFHSCLFFTSFSLLYTYELYPCCCFTDVLLLLSFHQFL